jgi:hypothetical protein
MKPTELFAEVVRNSTELPSEVRSSIHKARGIEESCFDETYIQFLDEQIRLSPRGPEWTEILRRRREGLRSFCNVSLISGHIRTGNFDTWIKIDPKKKTIVFWEQLEYNETN